MKLSKENEKRAKLALEVVRVFSKLGGEPITGPVLLEQNLVDLLANIAHLCDREGLGLPDLLRRSSAHYGAESQIRGGGQFIPLLSAIGGCQLVVLSDGNTAHWEMRTDPRTRVELATLICDGCEEELAGPQSVCSCHDPEE